MFCQNLNQNVIIVKKTVREPYAWLSKGLLFTIALLFAFPICDTQSRAIAWRRWQIILPRHAAKA